MRRDLFAISDASIRQYKELTSERLDRAARTRLLLALILALAAVATSFMVQP